MGNLSDLFCTAFCTAFCSIAASAKSFRLTGFRIRRIPSVQVISMEGSYPRKNTCPTLRSDWHFPADSSDDLPFAESASSLLVCSCLRITLCRLEFFCNLLLPFPDLFKCWIHRTPRFITYCTRRILASVLGVTGTLRSNFSSPKKPVPGQNFPYLSRTGLNIHPRCHLASIKSCLNGIPSYS